MILNSRYGKFILPDLPISKTELILKFLEELNIDISIRSRLSFITITRFVTTYYSIGRSHIINNTDTISTKCKRVIAYLAVLYLNLTLEEIGNELKVGRDCVSRYIKYVKENKNEYEEIIKSFRKKILTN